MTLNIRQVDFYMTQRNKGLTQEASAATTSIFVRSGRQIEKGLWQQAKERHWCTRTYKACHGEEKEVMFRQEHHPDLRALSDFT
ncbi:putative iSAfe9, transposase [Candidatus Erwinia dacicola]|uniref:ISAfe9, transposase n=1 Tax=Candidatus Erwinia dacicola TaxID=252393 RepID=A0A328TG65_9GAMM|nr:putative iSAfe9, transposase [Candidatus Erwinia dacicola]